MLFSSPSWNTPIFLKEGHPLLPWFILANVTYISLISVFSATGGFVADSTIRGALRLSSDDLQWISISFIMMLGIILPYAIWLAERYGYKRMFFVGTLIFLLGSFLNSLAYDFYSLLISRALAGMGAGALFPISLAVIDRTFPKERLTLAISLYIGLGFGGGTLVAFLAGGYLVQYLSWQSVFWMCGILSLPVLVATWLFHAETEEKKNRPFDFWGYGAFILFISTLLLILSSAKAEWNTQGWTSPFILTCEALAVIGFIGWIVIELNVKSPLVDLSLFKIRSYMLGCTSLFFVGAALYANQILDVNFLDQNLKYEKHMVGLYLAPQGLIFGLMGASVAFLTKKIDIRILTLLGMALVSLSCWMGMFVTIYSSHAQMQWVWGVRMFGVGCVVGPATAYALSEVPKALGGAAAVFIILCRQIGGTLGSLAANVITVQRSVLHAERFGTQINPMSPRFEQVISNLQQHLVHQGGQTPQDSRELALGLVQENLITQATVVAMNDAFFVLGILLALITLGVACDMFYRQFKLKPR